MASGEENKPGVHRQTSVPSQYVGTGMTPMRTSLSVNATGQSLVFSPATFNSGLTRFNKTVTGNQSSPRPLTKDNLSSTVGARPKQFPITSWAASYTIPNNETASARENVQYGSQLEETVKLKKILSRFSDKMKQDLTAKCPQLSVKSLESDCDVVFVLKGSENLIRDGKRMLESFEKELKCKKVYFTADVNEALHHLYVEKRINDRLLKSHPECIAMQNRNEIRVCGFVDETKIKNACTFVVQMIERCEMFLNGDLRSKKSDIETHLQKKFGDELLVCVDSLYRLHLVGFKEAVDEANRDIIDLKEGRISININHLSKEPYEDKTLYYQVGNSKIFSFIEQESLLKDIGREFGVSIVLHHTNCMIEMRGPSKNAQKAYEKIEMFEKNILLTSTTFGNPLVVSYLKGDQGNEYCDSLGHKCHVLTEREVIVHVEKITITKQCFNQSIVWSVPHGRKLIIEKTSMDNVHTSLKASPVILGSGESRKFERKGNIVTVGLPSFKDGNQSEEYGLEDIWTTLIRKAAEGKEKALGIPLAPVATWNIEKYANSLVKSCFNWLLDWSDNSPECVILFTDNQDYFQKTDACAEELVNFWLKEMNTRPKIRLIQAQLNQTEADVLVNTTSFNLELSHGSVSAALSKQAGPDLQLECKRKYPDGIKHGEVAITGGHSLMCKQIFHITLPQYNSDKYMMEQIQSIRRTVCNCLFKASKCGFETIAFPVIGTGNLQYPEDIVVSEMFGGVMRHRQHCPFTTLKEVLFVIFPKDTALFKQFKKYEEKSLATPGTSSEPRCEVKINIIGARQDVLGAKAELDRMASTFVDRSTEETNRNRRNKLATTKGDRREKEMGISGDGNPSGKIVGPCRFSWSTDAEKVDAYETGNLVIRVYKADILNTPVEGIVNAANQDLRHVGGVALAIAKAAGEKNLKQECEEAIKNNKGPLRVSTVVCTSAGNQHFKHIIHAVGPRWSEYKPITERSLRQCSDDLKQTITNCLMAAEGKGLESIVMPTVSSGRFGVPKEICAAQYAKAILEFSGKNDSLREVHIVDISEEMIDIVHKTFYAMFTAGKLPPSFSSRDYVDASGKGNRNIDVAGFKSLNSTERHGPRSPQNNEVHREDSKKESLQHKSQTEKLVFSFSPVHQVHVYTGDIVQLLGISAVACSETINGDAKGKLSKALLQKGGSKYKRSKDTQFSNTRAIGEIITTEGGDNNFTWILHAITPRQDVKLLRNVYRNIFEEVKSREITTLALPLLGSGDLGPMICSQSLLNELVTFCQTNTQFKLVLHVVVDDAEICNRVKDALVRFIKDIKKDSPENVTVNLKDTAPDVKADVDDHCVICMDTVTDAKRLKCGHTFCTECIDGYFRVKQVCPTCGKVCGTITGDQPDGTMHIRKTLNIIAGFEGHKSIMITYSFEHGKQGANHPKPGTFVKGITRSAYLPDNAEGREICAMLKIAFERRLVFTIGTSRTTGREGVITWNDIHHKTDIRPNTQFGYPDGTYLQRVRDELGAKGVTKEDVEKEFLLNDLKKDQFTITVTAM